MDALEQFLGGAAPPKPSKKSGDPTAQEMAGVKDLQDSLSQMQSSLPDYVPGSPSHKRTLADIKSIQSELQRHGTAVQPAAQATQPTQTPTVDPLEAFFSGKPVTVAQPIQSPEMTTGTAEGTMGAYVPRPTVGPVAAKVAGIANKYLQAKQNLGERTAGALDTLYGIVPATYGAVIQGLARTAQTPEQAAQTGQAAATSVEKPVGKYLGITGKETYQQPLGGITQPIAEQVNKMFNVLGMTPEQISEKTGVPAADIRNMVVIGSTAIPQAIKEVAPVVKQAGQAIATPIKQAAAELEMVKPLTKEQAQAQFAAKQAPEGSAGAAAAANNPYAGQITGEETVRGQFPQVKLSKTPNDVPVSEQQLRSQIVQEVAPEGGVRPGVVTGNENTLRTEYTKAKLGTPEGDVYKQKIANEQAALSKYAKDRVNATGASTRLINDEQRGTTINDVFHGQSPMDETPTSMMGYLNQGKKQIYNSAFEKMGNNKIETTHLDKFVNDPLEISTFKAAGQKQLLEGAKELIDLARTTGFKMRDGTILEPKSVASYDHVRKILNSPKIWNRDRASFIRDINGAIDQDIAAVADPALYKLGDNIHKLEKTIFGSKGIKTLFGEMDANGVVTSSTPLEKIPTKLNNLPKDQWRHVRDTLSELSQGRVRNAPEGIPPVPQELRQAATAALAEIDGALAREVQSAGASKMGEWNQNSANEVMNSIVGEKILETFPPDEVRKFHVLNYAGHLMPGIHGYEGAALQARRIGMIEGNLGKLGTGAGAAIGGFVGEAPGAALGAFVGGQAGVKASERMAAKAASREALKAQADLQKAAAIGKQTGKNKLQDLSK
jgi:hypothetical protein